MNRPKAIRLAAAACLIALVAGACTGGRVGGGRLDTASSPSPDAEDAEGGGRDASAEDRPSPEPARRDGDPEPVADDPADVVSTFLTAIDAEDYTTQTAYTTDAVAALVSIRDVIEQENARRGASTDNSVQVREPPTVRQVAETEAVVDVKAMVSSLVYGDKGREASDNAIEGPVLLRRVEQSWRIADLVYSGEGLAAQWVPVDARESRNGFTLAVSTFLSYKKTTAALIRLTNDDPDAGLVPLSVDPATLLAADGSERKQTQFAFESSGTPAGFLAFVRAEGRPSGMSLPVERDDTKQSWTFELRF